MTIPIETKIKRTFKDIEGFTEFEITSQISSEIVSFKGEGMSEEECLLELIICEHKRREKL